MLIKDSLCRDRAEKHNRNYTEILFVKLKLSSRVPMVILLFIFGTTFKVLSKFSLFSESKDYPDSLAITYSVLETSCP
jgi:hypothetical protein